MICLAEDEHKKTNGGRQGEHLQNTKSQQSYFIEYHLPASADYPGEIVDEIENVGIWQRKNIVVESIAESYVNCVNSL